ncbi:hypothetical protein ACV566_13890 [Staphylococcus aureus]
MQTIGKSLEAKVTIASNDKFNASEFLTSFDALHQLFIVSQVKVVDKLDDQATAYEDGDIVIEHADGEEKCEDVGTIERILAWSVIMNPRPHGCQ